MHAISQNLLRLQFSALLAAAVTFGQFYFMQFLIIVDEYAGSLPSVIRIVDATMPQFEQELVLEIPAPEPIEPPPVTSTPPPATDKGAWTDWKPVSIWQEPAGPVQHENDIPLSDNLMIPLIRTAPNYPSRALAREIEGYVELSFTVNAQGDVEDPIVLYAEPDGYFERAALQSIRRWKYAPQVQDSTPVATYDVRQRIVFEIER